ncbi:MAG: ABC transporter ATP-binding protein [Alphaproteobacteria bacterium]
MASVELTNISKNYGAVEVIRGLNLSVPDGSFTALLGPSGCGKSTLLRMIAGLEEITGGSARIGGTDITHEAPARRGVAMVFQSYALYPHLTVEQNICFSMSLAGESKAVQKQKSAHVAQMLQLDTLMDRRPAQLSGGQRQRVAIGRALVRDPKVFLFDEPLSNLDALLRVQMRLELARLHQDLKTTMIYVTHDQIEAMTLADQIVVLDKGVVQQVGSPLELYNSPANRFVAGFIGSPAMNFVPVTPQSDSLTLPGGGSLGLRPKGDVAEVGIRPEHLRILPQGQGHLQGTTRVVEQLGNTSYVYIDTQAGTVVPEVPPGSTPSTGEPVGVALDLEHLHVFSAGGRVLQR